MAYGQLVSAADDLASQARKAGTPRAENDAEMMTEKAQTRQAGIGKSKENDLFHGHRAGKKGATFGGKQ